jgi:L-lactate dehydrogenase complex protein LldG
MERTDNPGRERVLSRIRSGLSRAAPEHPPTPAARIFAPVSDPLARFQKECADNVTECILTSGGAATAESLCGLLQGIAPGGVYFEDAPVLRRIAEKSIGDRPIRWSSEGPPKENSQATVTLAESLVASTGSVLVASRNGGRGASVIAPVHIVIASKSQLEPDLDAALAQASRRGLPANNSFLCLITGSSRTADIEKILVLGAHGPRRLVVLLAEHLD